MSSRAGHGGLINRHHLYALLGGRHVYITPCMRGPADISCRWLSRAVCVGVHVPMAFIVVHVWWHCCRGKRNKLMMMTVLHRLQGTPGMLTTGMHLVRPVGGASQARREPSWLFPGCFLTIYPSSQRQYRQAIHQRCPLHPISPSPKQHQCESFNTSSALPCRTTNAQYHR